MTQVKRIAILSCLKATGVCSGAACFKAFNQKSSFFEPYFGETLEMIGFFHCNGCFCNYDQDPEYLEKISTLKDLKPDVIHVGKCTLIEGKECSVITDIIHYFEKNKISIVRGTH